MVTGTNVEVFYFLCMVQAEAAAKKKKEEDEKKLREKAADPAAAKPSGDVSVKITVPGV